MSVDYRLHQIGVRFATFALLMAWLCVVLPHHCQAESLSEYKQFLTTVDNKLSAIYKQQQSSPVKAAEQLSSLENNIPESISVTESTSSTKVDLTWLHMAVSGVIDAKGQQRLPLIDHIRSRIATYSMLIPTPAALSASQAANAHTVLVNELRKGKYKPNSDYYLSSWLVRKVRDLSNAINEALNRTFSLAKYASLVRMLIIAVTIIALVVVITKLFMELMNKQEGIPHSEAKQQTQQKIIDKPSWNSALEKANQDANEGRYQEAYRCVYMAALLHLDDKEALKYRQDVTNWEYVKSLRSSDNKELVQLFRSMTLAFDEMIYAKRDVSMDDYNTYLNRYRDLEAKL